MSVPDESLVCAHGVASERLNDLHRENCTLKRPLTDAEFTDVRPVTADRSVRPALPTCRPGAMLHTAHDTAVPILTGMTPDTTQDLQLSTDLALIVWPGQPAARGVTAGSSSWESVSFGPWTMSAAKAENVRVLVAVHQDVVVGAWSVVGRSCKPWIAPTGRTLHRCMFDTAADPTADRLVGHPSPQRSRRNPLCLMQLRDVPGYQLDNDDVTESFGRVQLGQYIFTVFRDGTAEVLVPPDGSVVMRPSTDDTPETNGT